MSEQLVSARHLRRRILELSRQSDDLQSKLSDAQAALGELLEQYQGLCKHRRVVEFSGELCNDFGDVVTDKPMRVCLVCNLVEQDGRYQKLAGPPAQTADYSQMGRFSALGRKLA